MSSTITGPDSSASPYVVPTVDYVTITSLLTVGDTAPDNASTGWRFVGIPDGTGAYANDDGTLNLIVNHELGSTSGIVRDHGSKGAFLDLIVLDPATGDIISGDDLIQSGEDIFTWNGVDYVAGTTAWNRFCSADLPALSAFYDANTGLGTEERIYLTGEEAGSEGRAFAFVLTDVDTTDGTAARVAYELPWMGNFSYENAVASADSGAKTVVISLDDSGGGQLYVYVGDKQATGNAIERAGLTEGDLFGIKVTGLTAETNGSSLPTAGATFTLQQMGADGDVSGMTGVQLEAESAAEGVTAFLRPEDGAFDPTNPNAFYFVTTNGFGSPSRLWVLEFENIENPLAGGTIRLLLDGTEGQQMFDNLTVTEDGLVILQEDPGGQDYLAKIWMYDPNADQRSVETPDGATGLTLIAQHDPARFAPGVASPLLTRDEESSGMIDVTSMVSDDEHLTFLFDVQAHYNIAGELVQGGQLLSMTMDLAVDAEATIAGTNGDDALAGTWGADIIDGDFGDDVIVASHGDDRLIGNYGHDSLDGGNGDDELDGGVGDDSLIGGNGRDVLLGGTGADHLDGGNGDDVLNGEVGDDHLLGGKGVDQLIGGFGNDLLDGGQGDDILTGGNGWDDFVFYKTSGADRITDFLVGQDQLIFADDAKVLSLSEIDTDADSLVDATVVSYVGGSVTLLGVTGVDLYDLVA